MLSAPYIGPPSEAAVAAVVICTHQHRPGGGKAALGEGQLRPVLVQRRLGDLRRLVGAVGEVDGVERAARRVLQRLVQRHRHAHVAAQLMVFCPVRGGQAHVKEAGPGQAAPGLLSGFAGVFRFVAAFGLVRGFRLIRVFVHGGQRLRCGGEIPLQLFALQLPHLQRGVPQEAEALRVIGDGDGGRPAPGAQVLEDHGLRAYDGVDAGFVHRKAEGRQILRGFHHIGPVVQDADQLQLPEAGRPVGIQRHADGALRLQRRPIRAEKAQLQGLHQRHPAVRRLHRLPRPPQDVRVFDRRSPQQGIRREDARVRLHDHMDVVQAVPARVRRQAEQLSLRHKGRVRLRFLPKARELRRGRFPIVVPVRRVRLRKRRVLGRGRFCRVRFVPCGAVGLRQLRQLGLRRIRLRSGGFVFLRKRGKFRRVRFRRAFGVFGLLRERRERRRGRVICVVGVFLERRVLRCGRFLPVSPGLRFLPGVRVFRRVFDRRLYGAPRPVLRLAGLRHGKRRQTQGQQQRQRRQKTEKPFAMLHVVTLLAIPIGLCSDPAASQPLPFPDANASEKTSNLHVSLTIILYFGKGGNASIYFNFLII